MLDSPDKQFILLLYTMLICKNSYACKALVDECKVHFVALDLDMCNEKVKFWFNGHRSYSKATVGGGLMGDESAR